MNYYLVWILVKSRTEGQTDRQKQSDACEPTVHMHRCAPIFTFPVTFWKFYRLHVWEKSISTILPKSHKKLFKTTDFSKGWSVTGNTNIFSLQLPEGFDISPQIFFYWQHRMVQQIRSRLPSRFIFILNWPIPGAMKRRSPLTWLQWFFAFFCSYDSCIHVVEVVHWGILLVRQDSHCFTSTLL